MEVDKLVIKVGRQSIDGWECVSMFELSRVHYLRPHLLRLLEGQLTLEEYLSSEISKLQKHGCLSNTSIAQERGFLSHLED